MLPIVFHKRLFFCLFIGFILAVVAGVLSHESGHWIAGRYFGFKDQHIGYNYTSPGKPNETWLRRDSILRAQNADYKSGADFGGKQEYQKILSEQDYNYFLITAGGPLQTMIAGTIGLLLLLLYRRKFSNTSNLSFTQWVMVFLSLFWLRELFDVVVAIIRKCAGHAWMEGDEFKMANALNWPTWSIFTTTSIVSLLVLWVVVFRFIPAKQRLTFIIAGFTGGLTGAYLWLVLLGPKLMP
jgi:hypothetical protein